MICLWPLWRVMAWIGVRLRWLRAERTKGKGRWPDKSAAVGVGAGHWNNSAISAVALNPLLAHGNNFLMKSGQVAPSAGYIHLCSLALQ